MENAISERKFYWYEGTKMKLKMQLKFYFAVEEQYLFSHCIPNNPGEKVT